VAEVLDIPAGGFYEHYTQRCTICSRRIRQPQDGTRNLCIVQVFRRWDSLTALGLPMNIKDPAGCVGFVPVFDNPGDAYKWRDEEHPDATVVAIWPGAE
jgi:hypothetical protein